MKARMLVAVVVFLGGSLCFSRGVDAQGDLTTIRDDTLRLANACGSVDGWENEHSLTTDILNVDKRVTQTIVSLFQEYGDVVAVAKASEGVLVWREMPHNANSESLTKFLYGTEKADKKLQVYYRRWRDADAGDVYVLQNSYWNRGDRNRICPPIYTVSVHGNKVTTSTLPWPTGAVPYVQGYDSAPCILGITPSSDAFPGVVIMDGPHGSGHFSALYLYTYDSASRQWLVSPTLSYSGSVDFSYNDENSSFRYECVSAEGVEQKTYVFCANRSPVRMTVQFLKDEVNAGLRCPVRVSWSNAGDAAVRLRLPYANEKAFRTGLLRACLQRGIEMPILSQVNDAATPLEKKDGYVEIPAHAEYDMVVDLALALKGLPEGKSTISLEYSNESGAHDAFQGFIKSAAVPISFSRDLKPLKN